MEIKGYLNCVEKRLECLGPILPYLETKEGIKTPLRIDSEIKTEEVIDRMIDLYENYWGEDEIDEMLVFFQSPLGRKLIASNKDLVCRLMAVLDEYIMEKMQAAKKSKLH